MAPSYRLPNLYLVIIRSLKCCTVLQGHALELSEQTENQILEVCRCLLQKLASSYRSLTNVCTWPKETRQSRMVSPFPEMKKNYRPKAPPNPAIKPKGTHRPLSLDDCTRRSIRLDPVVLHHLGPDINLLVDKHSS